MLPSAFAGVDALLRPQSIAIVGATPKVETLGGRPILNLRMQGFGGRIYPVNPRYDNVLGLRCYPDLRALPEAPDVVLVLVGQDRIFATLDDALAVGAKVALVFGSGFAEVAGEGVARQQRLKGYAERGLRICGPNCNGVFSVSNKTALGFTPTFEFPARLGKVALICQSGNVNTCVSSRGMELGLGFSHLVATGNEVDLEVADFVDYLLDDPATEVFALFVEGFKNPARFLAVADAALRRGKTIVLMKMGRTVLSQRVAMSHTGTLTGSYEVIVGALRQKGVIVVDSLDQLCGIASLLATGKKPRGGRVAVASMSGGMAGVIADACHTWGVPLAEFTSATEQGLSANLPGVANLANPLDMTGQVVNEPDCWAHCIDVLVADPGVDVLVSTLSITAGHSERRFVEDLVALAERNEVLQVCIWLSGTPPGSGFEVLEGSALMAHTRVDDAIAAVAAWRHYWTTRPARIAALDAQAQGQLQAAAAGAVPSWSSGWELLQAAGIPVARHALLGRRDEVAGALARLRYPLALKIESAAVSHKTELNALRLGLRNEAEVLAAYDELAALALREADGAPARMLAQEMVAGKRELILGLKQEPGVGTAVLVGIGGIFSEALRDVSIRVAPLTRLDAQEMLGELRAGALLGALRGLAAVRPGLLEDLLLKLSALALQQAGRVAELDINPLIVRDDGSGCVAVDVLVAAAGG